MAAGDVASTGDAMWRRVVAALAVVIVARGSFSYEQGVISDARAGVKETSLLSLRQFPTIFTFPHEVVDDRRD